MDIPPAMPSPFSPHDAEKLGKLAKIYIQAKELIIYSEEVDEESKSNLQIIKELRDAFDHLMRVISVRVGESSGKSDPDQYCQDNIEKAIGHVYRAAYDALDGTALSLKSKIHTNLNGVPSSCAKEIIPHYWENRANLEAATNSIVQQRTGKDVSSGDLEHKFLQYLDAIEKLKEFHNLTLRHGVLLSECANEQSQGHKRTEASNLKVAIIAAALGAALALIATPAVSFISGKLNPPPSITNTAPLPPPNASQPN